MKNTPNFANASIGKQKGFSTLLGLLLFIVLAGGGLYLYTAKTSKEMSEVNSVSTTTQKETKQTYKEIEKENKIKNTGDVGYQQYTNNQFNFSVKHPDTWNIKDITAPGEGNSDLWLHIQNNDEEFPLGSNQWKTASFVDIQVSAITPKNEKMFLSYVQNTEKIVLGGKEYDARIYNDYPFDLNSTEAASSRVYLINDGNLYVLSYASANKEEYIKNKEVLGKILSSFTFTN